MQVVLSASVCDMISLVKVGISVSAGSGVLHDKIAAGRVS
jgi:hypothetical protein